MGVGRQEIYSQGTINQKSLELEIFFFLNVTSQYVRKDINIGTQNNSVISTALFNTDCVRGVGSGSRNKILIYIPFIL